MRPNVASGPWPRLQRAWDVRAACNFIGGGTGTGLILWSTVAALVGADWLLTAVLGLAFVAFGLTMVFLEIGRPWRAFNVFLHPQTSWMTREGVLALPLFGTGVLAVGLEFFDWHGAALAALIPTALAAAGFLYCQARILRAARGIPSWREPALTPYVLITGLTEGGALFTAIHAGAAWPAVIALGLIAARATGWWRYRSTLARRGAPEVTLEVLDRLTPRLLAVGHGLPALLLLAALAVPEWPLLAIAAGLIAAGCGWRAKLILITRAAQTQGFAIPRTPVRGRGTSRTSSARPGWVAR